MILSRGRNELTGEFTLYILFTHRSLCNNVLFNFLVNFTAPASNSVFLFNIHFNKITNIHFIYRLLIDIYAT